MLFTDWNRSGTPSLRVSNDREYYKGGQEQLWHVDPGEPPALYTEAEGWKRLRIWGMGIASHDLNCDGYPEYFLTSMADNKLQTLASVPETGAPLPAYADVAFARGVTAHRPYTGGDIKPSDRLARAVRGREQRRPGRSVHRQGQRRRRCRTSPLKDPNNLLLQAADGTFVEEGDVAGVASLATGRGAALADFNLDGLLDLVVVNRGSGAQIWRNATPDAGHWMQVRLAQPAPNRDAIGAWVEVSGRGDGDAARNHRGRRPCRRPDRLVALRAGARPTPPRCA